MHQRLSERLFQDGIEEPYKGPENRLEGSGRKELSDEGKVLVNAIVGRMQGSCKDSCVIPKEAQPYVPKAIDAIKRVGDGSIPVGINRAEDQFFAIDGEQKTKKAIKDRAIGTVTAIIVTAFAGLLIYGIIFWFKKQGG